MATRKALTAMQCGRILDVIGAGTHRERLDEMPTTQQQAQTVADESYMPTTHAFDVQSAINETYRNANESDVEWMSRLAVRDDVRRAAWLAQWNVVTF